jgi:hypothetical protein
MRLKESGGIGAASDFEQAHRSDAVVYICFFDGLFAAPQAAPPPGQPVPPPFNRARIVVSADGQASLDSAGYHDTPGFGPGRGEIAIARPTP